LPVAVEPLYHGAPHDRTAVVLPDQVTVCMGGKNHSSGSSSSVASSVKKHSISLSDISLCKLSLNFWYSFKFFGCYPLLCFFQCSLCEGGSVSSPLMTCALDCPSQPITGFGGQLPTTFLISSLSYTVRAVCCCSPRHTRLSVKSPTYVSIPDW